MLAPVQHLHMLGQLKNIWCAHTTQIRGIIGKLALYDIPTVHTLCAHLYFSSHNEHVYIRLMKSSWYTVYHSLYVSQALSTVLKGGNFVLVCTRSIEAMPAAKGRRALL